MQLRFNKYASKILYKFYKVDALGRKQKVLKGGCLLVAVILPDSPMTHQEGQRTEKEESHFGP